MSNPMHPRFDVLLLEDSPEDAELYRRQLAAIPNINFQITEANSVQKAKDSAVNRHFDCYVVDYNLPDASGLDFIRHLLEKNEEADLNAAIVFVTGQGDEELAAEAFRLGVHEYLTKKNVSEGRFARPVMNAIEKAQLMVQLHHFRDRLEQSNKDLSTFAHTAAHDLKSPLRRILSYCEIMQEDAAERLNDEDKRILERMRVNAGRMQSMVENLLSYSLIEYDEERKEMTDLGALVRDIVNEFQEQIEHEEACVTVGYLPTLPLYKERVRQLFSNLISNALKYKSEKPPRIDISGEDGEALVKVAVSDNGRGIPLGQKEQVFRDFKRLHAQEDIEGTGLGLSICKKIVERHGGEIWVDSEPDQGSTFYFTLKTE